MMPNRSLLPAPACQPTNTISAAPKMAMITPRVFTPVTCSFRNIAAMSIVATGVNVAISEKYTGVVKSSAHAVSVCEMTKPNKPPAMITSKSFRSTFSFGRNKLITQKISAAPRQRVAMYVMGVTHSSRRYLVTGTPRPKITFAVMIAACPSN